ncbi:MAG: nitrogenase reductase [Actinobacteria bacterium]|nr:nitrogenase reductase [Actinomycetota bacterium]
MPKVIVCGRGGSGKSTLVSLLAGELADRGAVLVVDADESNLGLNAMLGLEAPRCSIMDHLGGKPAVGSKLMARLRGEGDEDLSLFDGGLAFADLPQECSSGNGNVSMVRIGKIEHSMEGCACPMGAVARSFLKQLSVDKDQWVLVDTEAGIEHFGRGVLEGAEFILAMVEPSQEAVVLAEKACGLAKEAGKACGTVLTKVDGDTKPLLEEKLSRIGIPPIGSIPYSATLARENLEGEPLADASLREELRSILTSVISGMESYNMPRH